MKPRTDFGEHSDWYMGTRVETRPTPMPAKKRPAMKDPQLRAFCIPTPNEKMAVAAMIPHFRPTYCDIGEANKAPKLARKIWNVQ